MHARAMAEGFKTHVVDANMATYSSLLRSAEEATNPVWVDGMRLFRSLEPDSQQAFIAFMRNVAIDSVSSVLAIVDGVAFLDGQDGDVVMTCGGGRVSGDLQGEFLALFEEE